MCRLLQASILAMTIASVVYTAEAAAQDAPARESGATQATAAQTGAGQSGAAPAAAEQGQDIVVTAQKRAERLLDVPISITAVTSDTLNKAGAKNLSELNGVVPGVNFSSSPGYAITPITIRGLSGTGVALGDEPVAVYVDGIFQQAQNISASGLVDIARIEVLRGPQGTLQGRNATAGAILIQTADPESRFGGFANVKAMWPQEFRAEAAVTGALTSTLDGRLSFGHSDERGWAHNIATGTRAGSTRSTNIRGTLLWRPDDATRVRVSASYNDQDTSVAVARFAATTISTTTPAAVPAGTATPLTPLTPQQQSAILDDYNIALNLIPQSFIRTPLVAVQIDRDLGGVDLVSLSSWSRSLLTGQMDSDGLALTDRQGYNYNRTDYKNLSQELRLQSDSRGPFKWIVGGYLSHIIGAANIDIYNLSFSVPVNRVQYLGSRQIDNTFAVFGDGTYTLNRLIAITGGVRYTTESKTFRFDNPIYQVPTGTLLAPSAAYRPAKATFNKVNWRANVTVKPTDAVMLYASYSTGFKSGGFNFGGADPAFNPENIRSAELGAKASFGQRGSVTASVYRNRYNDLQVTSGIPTGGTAIQNAANAKIDGFEIEGLFRPVPALALSGNVSYSDARYASFPGARDINNLPVDASGNRLTRAPRWQYFLQAQYDSDLSETLALQLQTSWRWRDRIFYVATNQDAVTFQGAAYGELGANVNLTLKPQDLTFTVFATNLNNSRAVTNVQVNFAYPEASFNRPRSIGIGLSKRF